MEVFRNVIAGQALVGTYSCLTNQGGLIHPQASIEELDQLSSLLQLPLTAGTVNRGNPLIGSGLVVNDWSAFCGLDTTTTELQVIVLLMLDLCNACIKMPMVSHYLFISR